MVYTESTIRDWHRPARSFKMAKQKYSDFGVVVPLMFHPDAYFDAHNLKTKAKRATRKAVQSDRQNKMYDRELANYN
jgi:hypothetical protein